MSQPLRCSNVENQRNMVNSAGSKKAANVGRKRRVNRCLFGRPDREGTEQWLQKKIVEIQDQQKKKWNFDFDVECPSHDGDWDWVLVPASSLPSTYSTSSHGKKSRRTDFACQAENLEVQQDESASQSERSLCQNVPDLTVISMDNDAITPGRSLSQKRAKVQHGSNSPRNLTDFFGSRKRPFGVGLECPSKSSESVVEESLKESSSEKLPRLSCF